MRPAIAAGSLTDFYDAAKTVWRTGERKLDA